MSKSKINLFHPKKKKLQIGILDDTDNSIKFADGTIVKLPKLKNKDKKETKE